MKHKICKNISRQYYWIQKFKTIEPSKEWIHSGTNFPRIYEKLINLLTVSCTAYHLKIT